MSPARRPPAIRLRSARLLDIVTGELREPGDVLVVGVQVGGKHLAESLAHRGVQLDPSALLIVGLNGHVA